MENLLKQYVLWGGEGGLIGKFQIETGHKSDDLILRDYCDGKHFKSHPLGMITSQWLQVCMT